jgi:hypothetical protein
LERWGIFAQYPGDSKQIISGWLSLAIAMELVSPTVSYASISYAYVPHSTYYSARYSTRSAQQQQQPRYLNTQGQFIGKFLSLESASSGLSIYQSNAYFPIPRQVAHPLKQALASQIQRQLLYTNTVLEKEIIAQEHSKHYSQAGASGQQDSQSSSGRSFAI